MPSFKLEGDDAPDSPQSQGESPPPPSSSAPHDEFSYFLEDEGAPKAQPPAPTPAAAPPTPQPPTPIRPTGATPVNPTGVAPTTPLAGRPRPAGPPSNTNAVNALPDLMRPAQGRAPAGPRSNPSQPAGMNVPAAEAVTPVLTQPDASSIAESVTPSDDMSSGVQDFGTRVARILDSGEDIFTWVARVAVLVVGLSLAVLLAAIFIGGAASLATTPGLAQSQKGVDLIRFLTMATKGLTLGTLALAASLLLLSYDDNRLGAIVAGVGVLFHFAAPLGLTAVLGAKNPALREMTIQFFNVGKLILIVGMMKAFVDVGLWTWNLPNQIKSKQGAAGAVGFGNPVETKQRNIARQANMFSPCWKLPFCREPIRVLCPAFLAKTTCWKFGRGCYCDTEMVGRIVRNEPLEVIKAANTVQSKQAPPCGRCYIFLEHQTHKFRMISPLVLPVTIAFMFGIWPVYNRLFMGFTNTYLKLFSVLSVNTGNLAPKDLRASPEAQAAAAAGSLSTEDIAQVSSYMLGALLGFFLLIYLSKFVEWAIFKAKW